VTWRRAPQAFIEYGWTHKTSSHLTDSLGCLVV